MATDGYEFNADQNRLIGSLAGKMRFVGIFALFVGVLNIIMAIFVVTAIYRDRIPREWKAKTMEYLDQARKQLPEDVRKQADQYSLDKLPANDHLWGIAIGTGITGLFYLLLGVWTKSAGTSFQKIVDTQGSDIRNLMNGLGSLHQMYSLIYTLLMIVLIAGIISLVFTIFRSFAG
jgi:hypothetical protein